MKRRTESRSTRGFSMIELLMVVALASILISIAVPVIRYQLYRSRHLGVANQTFLLIQRGRIESIKRGVPVVVRADFDRDEVIAFADVNDADGAPVNDLLYNPTNEDDAKRGLSDYEIGRVVVPDDLYFWGAGDTAEEGPEAVVGLTDLPAGPNGVVLNPDGTAEDVGAFRFGDRRENYVEVAITQAATARTELRKYDPDQDPEPDGSEYHPRREDRPPWEWNYF